MYHFGAGLARFFIDEQKIQAINTSYYELTNLTHTSIVKGASGRGEAFIVRGAM